MNQLNEICISAYILLESLHMYYLIIVKCNWVLYNQHTYQIQLTNGVQLYLKHVVTVLNFSPFSLLFRTGNIDANTGIDACRIIVIVVAAPEAMRGQSKHKISSTSRSLDHCHVPCHVLSPDLPRYSLTLAFQWSSNYCGLAGLGESCKCRHHSWKSVETSESKVERKRKWCATSANSVSHDT